MSEHVPEQEPAGAGVVHPGRPPRLQRIGRTAAVAGVVGFLALLAFLTTRYSHGVPRPSGEAEARPAVLAQPLSAERIEEYARERLEEEMRARKRAPAPPDLGLPAGVEGGREVPERPAPSAVYVPPRPVAPARSERVRELPALRSPLSPGGGRGAPAPASVPAAPAPPSWDPSWDGLRRGLEGVWGSSALLGGSAAGGPGDWEALPGSPAAGPVPLEARRVELPSLDVHRLERVEPPVRPRLLSAGTVVPLVLTHDLATEVPGPVRAWVSWDVYDSLSHSVVLIPRGTLVLGMQAARTAPGDRRVLVAWTKLRLPSGVTYLLPELPAGSADGTAGARGEVDRHWWSRFGNAVALSLVGAGVQLSQPQERSAVQGFAPSEGQVVAQQLGIELGRLSQEVLRRGLDRPPTIHLSAGHRLTLLLTRDLAF